MGRGCVVIWLVSLIYFSSALNITEPVVNFNGNKLFLSMSGALENVISIMFQAEIHKKDKCVAFNVTYVTKHPWEVEIEFDKEIESDSTIKIRTITESTDNTITSLGSVYKVYGTKLTKESIQDNKFSKEMLDSLMSKCKPPVKIEPFRETEDSVNKKLIPGKLIMEENFDDSEINNSLWTHEVRDLYKSNQEFVVFTKQPINSKIDNNMLNITVTRKTISPYNTDVLKGCTTTDEELLLYECGRTSKSFQPKNFNDDLNGSASIHTREKFSFKYGRIEFRALFPRGDFLFPSKFAMKGFKYKIIFDLNISDIILTPTHYPPDDRYAPKIRLYSRGNKMLQTKDYIDFGGKTLFGSVLHWGRCENKSCMCPFDKYISKKSETEFSKYFHNYTIIWRDDKIIFKVDGETFGIITNKVLLKKFQTQVT